MKCGLLAVLAALPVIGWMAACAPSPAAVVDAPYALPFPREARPANYRAIDSALRFLQPGDLALRTGADQTSEMLRRMNLKNATFSHCGIASFEGGRWWVYHSIGGADNPDARMRRDRAELFFSPISNVALGIVRLRLDSARRRDALATMQRYWREGRTFDMAFDLRTDTALYCAEAVAKAVQAATGNAAFFTRTEMAGTIYIAVDDLYENPRAERICTIRFR